MKIFGKYQAIIGIILVLAGLTLALGHQYVFDEKDWVMGFLFGFAIVLLLDSIYE